MNGIREASTTPLLGESCSARGFNLWMGAGNDKLACARCSLPGNATKAVAPAAARATTEML